MLAELLDKLKDAWLTWRTKKSKEQREWEAWYEVNVNYRASTISDMFMHFKHVIIVDPAKFFNLCEPFAYVPTEDAKQYFWPARKLGENAVWRFERVMPDDGTTDWIINGIGDRDKVFVATNNDRDAMMIALKYMS